VTCNDRCYQITSSDSQHILALKSTHENEDGRIFMHVAYSATHRYNSELISSDDTDVFVMCLTFHADILAKLFQTCGTKARTNFLDVEKIAKSVGTNVRQVLIGVNVYSGCVAVIPFAESENLSAVKLLSTNNDMQQKSCV